MFPIQMAPVILRSAQNPGVPCHSERIPVILSGAKNPGGRRADSSLRSE